MDAYHGPEEWAAQAAEEQKPLDSLETDAQGLLISVARANADAPSIRGAMLERLARAALRGCDALTGDSADILAAAAGLGADRRRCYRVLWGVDFDIFRPFVSRTVA